MFTLPHRSPHLIIFLKVWWTRAQMTKPEFALISSLLIKSIKWLWNVKVYTVFGTFTIYRSCCHLPLVIPQVRTNRGNEKQQQSQEIYWNSKKIYQNKLSNILRVWYGRISCIINQSGLCSLWESSEERTIVCYCDSGPNLPLFDWPRRNGCSGINIFKKRIRLWVSHNSVHWFDCLIYFCITELLQHARIFW